MVSHFEMADHIFIYSNLDLRHGAQVENNKN